MINLPAETVAALPIDQLGMAILDDLLKSAEWNEYNYTLGAQTHFGDGRRPKRLQRRWLGFERRP